MILSNRDGPERAGGRRRYWPDKSDPGQCALPSVRTPHRLVAMQVDGLKLARRRLECQTGFPSRRRLHLRGCRRHWRSRRQPRRRRRWVVRPACPRSLRTPSRQSRTVRSRKPQVKPLPALTAVNVPGGGVAWPSSLWPQQATVPLVRRPQACAPPALTDVEGARRGVQAIPVVQAPADDRSVRAHAAVVEVTGADGGEGPSRRIGLACLPFRSRRCCCPSRRRCRWRGCRRCDVRRRRQQSNELGRLGAAEGPGEETARTSSRWSR